MRTNNSIFDDDMPNKCFLCGAECNPDEHFAEHHVFGGPCRSISDRYGLLVHLCGTCHSLIHDSEKGKDMKLQLHHPSSDLMHLMLPVMSYEHGHCRPECTRCSEVCPAGAIFKVDKDEKSSIQIGHAVWIKKNCVPITDEVECGNCARHCPTGAIEMVPLDEENEESPMVPAINEAACIGCGACEYVCPSRPFSAIYVEGHEVHKKI